MNHTRLTILFAIINIISQPLSQAEPVQLGKRFVSPNKMFTFQIEYYDRQYHFAIDDVNSKRTVSIADEFGPILAVKWTNNSTAILVANHYARGKLLEVVSLSRGKWDLKEVTPPETRAYEYEVLDWKCKDDGVQLFFKVIIGSNSSPEAYRCSFDYDVANGSISNYSKSLISIDTYAKTKSAL